MPESNSYRCLDHPMIALNHVREIRDDVGRPDGATVIGVCVVCERDSKYSGRTFSYGRAPAAALTPSGEATATPETSDANG